MDPCPTQPVTKYGLPCDLTYIENADKRGEK